MELPNIGTVLSCCVFIKYLESDIADIAAIFIILLAMSFTPY